jgi:hypothetical protein
MRFRFGKAAKRAHQRSGIVERGHKTGAQANRRVERLRRLLARARLLVDDTQIVVRIGVSRRLLDRAPIGKHRFAPPA